MPVVLTDNQDNVHIAWLENSNVSAGEEVVYTRLNHTNDAYPDGIPLNSLATYIIDEWEVTPVTRWASDKLGPNTGRAPELGQPPAFANDMGSEVCRNTLLVTSNVPRKAFGELASALTIFGTNGMPMSRWISP